MILINGRERARKHFTPKVAEPSDDASEANHETDLSCITCEKKLTKNSGSGGSSPLAASLMIQRIQMR